MSNQDVSALFPKGIKENINGNEFVIWPLPMDDMAKFASEDPSVVSENMTEIVAKSLRCSIEDASKISVEYLNQLMDGIMKANKFEEMQNKHGDKIKEMLDKRKSKLAASQNGKTTNKPIAETPK